MVLLWEVCIGGAQLCKIHGLCAGGTADPGPSCAGTYRRELSGLSGTGAALPGAGHLRGKYPDQTSLQRQIGELLNELKDIFQGIYLIKDLSPKTSDTIVSYGERLSSIIVTELIEGAQWFDSRTFIKTEKKHNKHILDAELTNELVKKAFSSVPKVALVPGFISSDKTTGDVTNLGHALSRSGGAAA